MERFVGLDCGGSNCRVQGVDHTGEVVFSGQSGAANLISTPISRLRRNLASATEGLYGATHVCGCFAGLIDDERRRMALGLLAEIFPKARLRAEPDYAAALFAAPVDTRCCVVAGTGSLVCSLHGNEIRKSGGGGFLLGDEGSGFRYGRAAVAHWVRYPEEAPAVGPLVAKIFHTTRPGDTIAALHQSPAPATMLAKIAPALAKDAVEGQPYALEVLKTEGHALARVILIHLKEQCLESTVRICLSGGLWKSGRPFEQALRSAWCDLAGHEPDFVRTSLPPLAGAVRLAREIRN